MFNNARYITRGVNAEIPLGMQCLLWLAINSMEVVEKDYLQVFKLSAEENRQKITHTQEEPPYQRENCVPWDEPISAKVFVIDDGDHTTMLLAEEY